MFWTKVVDKIKKHTFCIQLLFYEIVPFMR